MAHAQTSRCWLEYSLQLVSLERMWGWEQEASSQLLRMGCGTLLGLGLLLYESLLACCQEAGCSCAGRMCGPGGSWVGALE